MSCRWSLSDCACADAWTWQFSLCSDCGERGRGVCLHRSAGGRIDKAVGLSEPGVCGKGGMENFFIMALSESQKGFIMLYRHN